MPKLELYDDMAKAIKDYIEHPDNSLFKRVAAQDVIIEASRHISTEDFKLVLISLLSQIDRIKS